MHPTFYEEVICPDCGESNKVSASFRWNGTRWEHRCHGVYPGLGHWPIEKLHWTSEQVDMEGNSE